MPNGHSDEPTSLIHMVIGTWSSCLHLTESIVLHYDGSRVRIMTLCEGGLERAISSNYWMALMVDSLSGLAPFSIFFDAEATTHQVRCVGLISLANLVCVSVAERISRFLYKSDSEAQHFLALG